MDVISAKYGSGYKDTKGWRVHYDPEVEDERCRVMDLPQKVGYIVRKDSLIDGPGCEVNGPVKGQKIKLFYFDGEAFHINHIYIKLDSPPKMGTLVWKPRALGFLSLFFSL